MVSQFPAARPGFHRPRTDGAGFALVVVVSLLVLLAVVAVGLLTLSTVTLRSTGATASRAQAEANARLAIAMALGQLQKQAGVDTRITAPADFLAPADPGAMANPAWRGVWRSNPETPRSYEPARSDFFASWLVTEAAQPLDLEAAREPLHGDTVVVRRAEGLPDVRVPLVATPEHGALGWWTDDESLKARADLPLKALPGRSDAAVASHAAPRTAPETLPEVVGFDPSIENTASMLTPAQISLGTEKWPDWQGAHFTTTARSVLADVRNGGLKQDLSALFEQEPERITEFGQWTGNRSLNSRQAYLYGSPAVAMGARWNHLYAYYNLYKDVSFNGSEPGVEPKAGLIDWHLADQYKDFGDEAGGFRFPRLAKIIYLFSYSAVKSTGSVKPGQEYTLQLVTDIYVTLWNPFDVRINFPMETTFLAKFSKGLPLKLDWEVNGTRKGSAEISEIIQTGGFFTQSRFYRRQAGRQFSMGPGETVVFSMKKTGNNEFWPGVFFEGGVTSDTLIRGGRKITGAGSDRVSVGLKPSQNSLGYTADGQGNSQYLDFWIYDTSKGWPFYEHRGEILARADAPFLKQMQPVESSEVPSVTLASVVGRKQPFGAFIMETKTALDSKVPIPACLNTGIARLSSRLTGKLAEFANERLEYKLEPVSGFDSDIIQVTLPSHPAGPDHGYIGSGRGPATGQTHFLYSAIPTVPPTSLAQFRHAGAGDGASTLRATHWDFNSTPNAPFADQSIGNSYAHPLVPPNVASKGRTLDHRYLGNEVLWDKYFLSSLAPRSAASFGTETSIAESWRSFLEGNSKLINSRFSPWLGGELPEPVYRRVFEDDRMTGMKPDAYKRISSNLLLDGGFNVNSTSVEAWRAFLASPRGRSITRLPKNGATKGEEVAGYGAIYSRTETVLSDSVDSNPGDLATHYSGFRDISDEELGELAEALVEQVRKRGPFLNLSEFINRRLVRDPGLALSGALQTAIDSSGLNDDVAAAGVPGSRAPGGIGMAFSEASGLSTAAGNPGWLMQGDILDPLGPALVARGDTFRIRGYGESRTPQGAVAARAWCEAVVQRFPAYMDASEAAEVTAPKLPVNRLFGRRYQVVAFRWLSGPQD